MQPVYAWVTGAAGMVGFFVTDVTYVRVFAMAAATFPL